jgi:hypothetical protein
MTTAEPDHDALLHLLLEICEDFFAHTGPATRDEVDLLLHAHGITGGPGWLIDMLALTRLQLPNPDPHNGPDPRDDG